jgi:hypothetical protein
MDTTTEKIKQFNPLHNWSQTDMKLQNKLKNLSKLQDIKRLVSLRVANDKTCQQKSKLNCTLAAIARKYLAR